jgi:exportin-1
MGPEFNQQFQALYRVFMTQLQLIIPPTINIPEAYERGSDEQQRFVQNLALFFTGFFKAHITALEQSVPEDQVGSGGVELALSFVY